MTDAATRLQREIHQRQPFRSPGHATVVALLRTADEIRRRFAALLEPEGITVQQYNVLRILRGAGDEGLPTLEIAQRMLERTPGITRLLDRLERKALVNRKRSTMDRRQVTCRITTDGLELLARLDEPIDRAEGSTVRGLDGSERENLLHLLEAVRKG